MDTINAAYAESKDALIGGKIDTENYLANVATIRMDMLDIKHFLESAIEETSQTLAAVRVLARNRPLMGYLLRRLTGHKYGKTFSSKRSAEVATLRAEVESTKRESRDRINKVLSGGNKKDS
jgi:hypothetical protein